jgi:hypothetical protein
MSQRQAKDMTANSQAIDWAASVYFAASFAKCKLNHAWAVLLDYERWNPTFVGAKVTPIKGTARSEGEVVLISKTPSDSKHESFPEFYCETVTVVPGRRIVWYVYAKDGHTYQDQNDPFRNFIDFGLTEESGGVRFNIYYYAQNRLSGNLLSSEREFMQPLLHEIATAFSAYCEATK